MYAYRCLDTIEQGIDEILRRKQALFDVVVDEVTVDLTRASSPGESSSSCSAWRTRIPDLSSSEGQPAVARPHSAGGRETEEGGSSWTVTSEVQTVAAGGPTDISIGSPREGVVVLSGTIAADADPVLKVYAFKDPSSYARTAFIEALGRAGVAVAGDPKARNSTASLGDPAAVDGLASVAELRSLPLDQHATYVLKISYNRGAQTMICLLAAADGSYDPAAPPGMSATAAWPGPPSCGPRPASTPRARPSSTAPAWRAT